MKIKLNLKPLDYVIMGGLVVAGVLTNVYFFSQGRTEGMKEAVSEIGRKALGDSE